MNNIALLGYGTVGKGVKELVDSLPASYGVRLTKVFDMPSKKAELGDLLVSDIKEVYEDPEISTVIECLGGDELPFQAISNCLKRKKNVISSNKETISLHLEEYFLSAKQSGASLQFEASCGGGIPLLYPLYVTSRFDQLTSLKGILNGTTNYILTRMQEEGMPFSLALKEAQKAGFAEKDPGADLEGLDMVRKSNILASLVFDGCFDNADIPHFGIAGIDGEILKFASQQGKIIRFISSIKKDGDKVYIGVLPELMDKGDFLGGIRMETNGVEARFCKNGPLYFGGLGAGKNATAAAIGQDLIRVITHTALSLTAPRPSLKAYPDLSGMFYGFTADGEMTCLINPSLESLKPFKFVCREREKR